MQVPSPQDVIDAAQRIEGHVQRTPVMTSAHLWDGGAIELKLEHTQITGCFKLRGAFNTLLSVDVPKGGVVAASGGNHGAAVAYAATALGHKAHIFVPEIAGPTKIGVIRDTGAALTVVPGVYADALAQARAYEAQTGAIQVHAYDLPQVLAGQGTVMHEWEEQGLEADTVLIAVGGGGLIGGCLSWLDGRRKVVAVEPEAAPSLHRALAAEAPVDVAVSGIAANALGATRIGTLGFAQAQTYGVPSVLVSDDAIADAQRLLWRRLRQYVEPAAAAGLAALVSGAYQPAPDEKVAVLLCGANPSEAPIG